MYVGSVGSGKTYCAVADALWNDGDFIYTNQPLDTGLLADFVAVPRKGKKQMVPKDVKVWRDFSDADVVDSRCGVLLIDEAHLWLDARKWDSLSPEARRKIVEHRKDDLLIISTTQDVSFIDKVYRILADEVRVVRRVSLPLVGFIWRYSIRPSLICVHCGRVRADGVGDDSSFLKRWLGFGTFYRWTVYSPKVLAMEGSASGDDLPEELAKGTGRRLFDIRVAGIYDTSKKLSDVARGAVAARKQAHAHEYKPSR